MHTCIRAANGTVNTCSFPTSEVFDSVVEYCSDADVNYKQLLLVPNRTGSPHSCTIFIASTTCKLRQGKAKATIPKHSYVFIWKINYIRHTIILIKCHC